MGEHKNLKELISSSEIDVKIKDIANDISLYFNNESVVFVIVLNGGFIFGSELTKSVDLDCEVDFIKVSSYNGRDPQTNIELEKDLSIDIAGKNVVIIEDIIDTGNTINYLIKLIERYNPKLIKVATLLLKPETAISKTNIDWVGFKIETDFVVGFGLDYDQKFRNLNGIYKLGGVN